ncbi:MAG TPA: hypothetical protein VII98_07345 [Solirubrobacteraceae bacterium]
MRVTLARAPAPAPPIAPRVEAAPPAGPSVDGLQLPPIEDSHPAVSWGPATQAGAVAPGLPPAAAAPVPAPAAHGVLARSPAPGAPGPSAPSPAAPAARQVARRADSAGENRVLARAAAPGGGGAGGGSGGDADAIYDEVLRRLRAEQEQLGQIIPHPF